MGGIVSTVSNLLGGTPQGAGFQATSAPVASTVTPTQVSASAAQQQAALTQQQNINNQLAAQNGTGNQSNVLNQQQILANQIANQAANTTGVTNQNNVFNQEQGLANQIQNETTGGGPNPAQDQYKQNIDTNTAAAAGTIASQKGISPALAAELVARAQGGANQGAAANEATLQAQQQLNAQQELQNQQAALASTAGNQVNNQITATGQLQNQQNSLQNVAGNQISNLLTGTNSVNNLSLGNESNTFGANAAQNNAQIQTSDATNAQNEAMASTNANNNAAFTTGVLTAAYNGPKAPTTGSKGGMVKKNDIMPLKGKNKRLIVPSHLHEIANIFHPKLMMADGGDVITNPDNSRVSAVIAANSGGSGGGGSVGGDSEEGGIGSLISDALPALLGKGGPIVAGSPKVNHNSLKNDVVPAMLTPKEIVLPLSVTQAKNAPEAAKKFVMALMSKDKEKSPGDEHEFKTALKNAIGKRKSK